MFVQKMILALAVPVLFAAGSARAADTAGQQCVFEKYSVRSVEPYRTDENFGYGGYARLRGAQLYVPAREGLTAEWLSLNVQQSFAQAAQAPQPECGPQLADVHVTVVSAGPGFWVQLGVTDAKDAQKLLEWAQSIAPAQPPAR